MRAIYSTTYLTELEPYFRVEINGYPLDFNLLKQVDFLSITEEENKKTRMELQLMDAEAVHVEEPVFELQQEVLLYIGYRNAYEVRGPFEIVLVDFDYSGRGIRLKIKGEEAGSLARSAHRRVFNTGTLFDLFQRVARENGARLSIEGLPPEQVYLPIDDENPVVQTGESDGEFLQRVANDYGWTMMATSGRIHLTPPFWRETLGVVYLLYNRADANLTKIKVKYRKPRVRYVGGPPDLPEDEIAEQNVDGEPSYTTEEMEEATVTVDAFGNVIYTMPDGIEVYATESTSRQGRTIYTLPDGTRTEVHPVNGPPEGARVGRRVPNRRLEEMQESVAAQRRWREYAMAQNMTPEEAALGMAHIARGGEVNDDGSISSIRRATLISPNEDEAEAFPSSGTWGGDEDSAVDASGAVTRRTDGVSVGANLEQRNEGAMPPWLNVEGESYDPSAPGSHPEDGGPPYEPRRRVIREGRLKEVGFDLKLGSVLFRPQTKILLEGAGSKLDGEYRVTKVIQKFAQSFTTQITTKPGWPRPEEDEDLSRQDGESLEDWTDRVDASVTEHISCLEPEVEERVTVSDTGEVIIEEVLTEPEFNQEDYALPDPSDYTAVWNEGLGIWQMRPN